MIFPIATASANLSKPGPALVGAKKVLQRRNKLKGGTLWGIFFPKKVSQCRKKTERGDPLVSSGIVCYAGNFLVLFPGPTGEI